MDPIGEAIYWTEYAIRHKGASHLRTAAVELRWYEYLLLDVILCLLITTIIFIIVIKKILLLLLDQFRSKSNSKISKKQR